MTRIQCVREWQRKNPDKVRAATRRYRQSGKSRLAWVKRLYGLGQEAYEAMILGQENQCAICKENFVTTPCVDHNHQTGKVRGLLCKGCNIIVGRLEHPLTLAAWAYIQERK